jgi:O-antigen/teichoic acid export membrane protein
MHFKFIGLTTMLSQLLGYGPISIYLASRGFGAHALIAGTILQVFILNTVFIFSQRSNLRFGWSISGLRELSGFVFGFASYKMADILKGNIDRILIGWFLGTAAVGFYGRTLYIFRIPEGTFGGTALRVLLPAFSRIQDQPIQLERSFRRAWIAVLICGIPVIVVIVACDINLILILLGEQWVEIQILLASMGIGFFFRLGNNVSGATITALGLVGQRAKYNWFLLGFATVSYPIGCIWGLRGIGIAYLVTEFLNTVLITRLAVRVVKVPGSQICRLLGNHFIAATLIGTSAWIASNSIYRTTDNPVGGVIMASAIVIIGYVIIVVAIPNFLLFKQQLWLIDTFLPTLGRVLPTTVIDRLELYLRRWERRNRV